MHGVVLVDGEAVLAIFIQMIDCFDVVVLWNFLFVIAFQNCYCRWIFFDCGTIDDVNLLDVS